MVRWLMFDLEGALYLHGEDVRAFCEKWDLEPFTCPCKCGSPLTTTIPFVHGRLRGLTSPPCKNGCHNERSHPPYCVVAVGTDGPGDIQGLWDAATENREKNRRIRKARKKR